MKTISHIITAFVSCIVLCSFAGITACNEGNGSDNKVIDTVKKIVEDTVPNIPNPFPLVHYEKRKIKNSAELSALRAKYGKAKESWTEYRAITTVNRKDIHYFRVGDTIMIPDTVDKDTRIYSCFPHYYHGARKLDKIIIVSNKLQAYACYEKGHLVRFAAGGTLSWKYRSQLAVIASLISPCASFSAMFLGFSSCSRLPCHADVRQSGCYLRGAELQYPPLEDAHFFVVAGGHCCYTGVECCRRFLLFFFG